MMMMMMMMMLMMWLIGGIGAKKRQRSFRFLQSLREVLTKQRTVGGRTVGGLAVDEQQVLCVRAMSTNNVGRDVDDVACQYRPHDTT